MLKLCLWGLGRNGGEVKRKTYKYDYLRPNNAFFRRAESKITREARQRKAGKAQFLLLDFNISFSKGSWNRATEGIVLF